MGEYGYTYRGYSTVNTVRGETRGPVIKPYVPSIPNNYNSEGNVTKKIIVPVGSSRPYGDDYSSQTDSYPNRVDDVRYPQTSPVRESPRTKVQNEASRPPWLPPMTSSDWRQSPQPTPYNYNNNGYADYGSNKEGRNPIGGTVRNDNHDGYYNGTNGYGDYGNKEGRKPIGSTIRNDNYGGYNGPNGYGEGYKPTTNDDYDGYNVGNNGYGNFNNKEGRKPFGSTIRNENYGGGYNEYGSNKEVQRPKISSAWTAAPRKGVQLSEPTHDIGKAIELLKKAAKVTSISNEEHSNKGGHKATGNGGSWLGGEPTNKIEKGMELVKEAERLKNIVTGPPHYVDSRRDGSTMDSSEAAKKFKGKRV